MCIAMRRSIYAIQLHIYIALLWQCFAEEQRTVQTTNSLGEEILYQGSCIKRIFHFRSNTLQNLKTSSVDIFPSIASF